MDYMLLDKVVKSVLLGYMFSIFSSFITCIFLRLMRNEKLLSRSHCDYCSTPLSWYELIPIFSALIFRFRCRYCNSKLDKNYTFLELISWLYGFSIFFIYFNTKDIFFLIAMSAYFFILHINAVLDYYYFVAYEFLSIIGSIIVVIFGILNESVAFYSYLLLLFAMLISSITDLIMPQDVFLFASFVCIFSYFEKILNISAFKLVYIYFFYSFIIYVSYYFKQKEKRLPYIYVHFIVVTLVFLSVSLLLYKKFA